MRKMILFGAAVILSATSLLAVTTLEPLSVNTGLWQVSMTTSINGFPPNTSNYKSCLKKEDLSMYPFTDPKDMCTWTVVSSSSTQMSANGTCMPPGIGKVTFNVQLTASDTQDVKGTGQLTFNGPAGNMNGNYSATAKWVSATCPAGMK